MGTPASARRSRQALGALLAGLATLAAACGGGASPTGGGPATIGAPDRVHLVVIGDFGSGTADEMAVSAAIRDWTDGRPIDALVTTGDNVYEDGHPDEFDRAWRQPYGWVEERGIPVIASLGNHDVKTDDGEPVMELLGMPHRWYERSAGPVDILVLDSNDPFSQEQAEWLEERLAASTAPWQLVILHHPPNSCADHGSDLQVRAVWLDDLEEGGADLVLAGHDHVYQRFAPIDGVTHVVTGGGGAELYDVRACPEGTPEPAAFDDREHHFLYLTITPDRIRGTAVSAAGRVLDSFSISPA
ncbi:MAG: metallophosphoesterase [Actinobacteria bacterium]|nr:metallophosphoesterase [Actinomycetota bacterium]